MSPRLARERMLRARHLGLDRVLVGRAMAGIGRDPRRHRLAGDAAEHGRVGDAVAAEPVGAVHAAGVLAGDEQARQLGRGVDAAHHAAHEVVRGRHHLDQPAGEIEAAVGAALDHALELLGAPSRARDGPS